MRIKELSKTTNLSISTIRYYEKIGLISPVKKGYFKQYTNEIKEQLIIIKKLHWSGLRLSDIKQLFVLQEKEPDQLNLLEINSVANLLSSAIQKVEAKQEQLSKAENMLKKMLEKVNTLYENR